MAQDKTAIFQLASTAAGGRSKISSPDEVSREAELCRLWFDPVRDQVLSAAYWPNTRATARLALLAERDPDLDWTSTDPEPGLVYAYAAPSDMVAPRYLSSFERFNYGPYNNAGTDVNAISANTANAILFYTKRQTNIGLWDPQLFMAIAYALGAHITMPLTGKRSRANDVASHANDLIIQARVTAANQQVESYEAIPDWISARGYAGSYPPTQYVYPLGALISIGNSIVQ